MSHTRDNSLHDFVNGVQAVLPALQIMGEVLEACGLKCEVSHMEENAWQIGCRWEQGTMSMKLTLALGDAEEIAWLWLSDEKNGSSFVLQAMNEDGVAKWSAVFDDSVRADSRLYKLEKDIRALVPEDDGKYGSVNLLNESLVHEVANMFAVFFKRQG